MSHTRALFALLTLSLLPLLACAAPTPAAPASDNEVTVAERLHSPYQLVGRMELVVDPLTLSAAIAPPERREGASQPPQALNYQIDISRFITPTSFEITQVRRGLGGNLEISWRHSHPFRAPVFANPINAGNRADLGYTGWLVNVQESSGALFFGGALDAPVGVATNPDVMLPIGDLHNPESPMSSLHPAWLLVDEARDNRDISNGGNDLGSYNPGNGGWQRANAGDPATGWTGFDTLHGGQSVTGMMSYRLPAIMPTTLTFDLAFLVKWTDPRGFASYLARFPTDPADVTQFAYREPFGALDVSQLIAPPAIVVEASAGTAEIVAALRDWDIEAPEGADADLSDETDVALVQPGASGAPVMEFSAPGVAASPIAMNHVAGTGLPSDFARYSGMLENTLSASPGDYWGLLRAIDPEDNDAAASDYRFGVDPTTLATDPARALPIRGYQVVRVLVRDFAATEALYATAAYGAGPKTGQTELVNYITGSPVPVPLTRGTDDGTAIGEFAAGHPSSLMLINPAGGLSDLSLAASGDTRTRRPYQNFAPTHPSRAPGPVSALPGTLPFVAIAAGATPNLRIGDFLTGKSLYTLNPPDALPQLTVTGMSLYSDLAGPDWDPSNAERAVVSLGDGVVAKVGLPPLTADGQFYTFDPSSPSTNFTKISNFATNGSKGGFYPDWSPDGSKIVFLYVDVNVFNLPASFKLATMDPGTGNITTLNLSGMGTPPGDADAYIPIHPTYNHDGSKIAFAALEVSLTNQEVYDADIWVLDGTTLTNRSDTDDAFEAYPVFY